MAEGDSPRSVAVVGAGSIGVAFALVFARAGREVQIWDAFEAAYPRARDELARRVKLLDVDRGPLLERIHFAESLEEAVAGAELVQECAPERVGLKRELVTTIAVCTGRDVVIASSSSALLPTAIAEPLGPVDAARLVVAHPGNPPYLLPIVEVVPGERTTGETVDRAVDFYRSAGMRPVRLNREIDGFIFNRLQGAVLREAYCLVRDGIASVADIDEVMRSGPGRRWSIIGPFETVDLNTRGGIVSHAQKMGPAYAAMGAERGQHDPWTPELVEQVASQRRELLPEAQWGDRVQWRDEQLARLSRVWDEIDAATPSPSKGGNCDE